MYIQQKLKEYKIELSAKSLGSFNDHCDHFTDYNIVLSE
jgi:hypothetical protein